MNNRSGNSPDKADLADKFFYLKETAELTKTGSWYIDTRTFEAYWNDITYEILEAPLDFVPTVETGLSHYAEEHRDYASKLFFDCYKKGKEFDVEIKMVTEKGNEFWARAIGKPVLNSDNEQIGVQGVFQNIDDIKQKEFALQNSVETITSQNSRLLNFAYIVSHNLRSQTSNLQLIVQLLDNLNTVEEKMEMLGNIKGVSDSLNKTIEHLNEVATIQTNSKQEKRVVRFEDTYLLVATSIQQIIANQKAEITTDFSDLDSINYVPAYMESIMLNLLTNAVKYKHPDRKPIIHIKTFLQNDQPIMEIKDNGVGIDLERYGEQIFGMYKTFHFNDDAEGVGLFITKNQIESLGGSISIKSTVDVGTTFTIIF
ncbi:PAS domain-containing sensor histidine kinase [Spongiivirga sp. MCCC 1A20706]|uniref:sensor histidine kinase n=1 Tax=Spongiivirga sp. MCCC 1A20706 TaxID=3160963 RepID=UPI00397739BE